VKKTPRPLIQFKGDKNYSKQQNLSIKPLAYLDVLYEKKEEPLAQTE
jgi:hypothetical protein